MTLVQRLSLAIGMAACFCAVHPLPGLSEEIKTVTVVEVKSPQKKHVLNIDEINRRLRKNANDVDALFDRILFYWQTQKYTAALADCKHVLKIAPSYKAYENQGAIYSLLGMHKEAIESLERALNLAPQHKQLYRNYALACFRRGQWSKCIDACSTALKARAEDPEPLSWRAQSYAKVGRIEAAKTDFAELIRRSADKYPPLFAKACMEGDAGQHKEAISDYDTCVEVLTAPSARKRRDCLAIVYNNRGLQYVELKEMAHALSDFDQAIMSNPRLATAYHNRGCIYAKQNEKAKAEKDFDTALALDPKKSGTYLNRFKIEAQTGSMEQAVADYQESRSLEHKGAATQTAEIDPGKYESVLKGYSELLSLGKRDTDCLYNKGIAEMCLGKTQEGVKDLLAYLHLAPADASTKANAAVWCCLGERELKKPEWANALLATARKSMDQSSRWPKPLLEYLAGNINADNLLKQSLSRQSQTEAHCIIGIDRLQKHDLKSAKENLSWVTTHGDDSTDYYFLGSYRLQTISKHSSH